MPPVPQDYNQVVISLMTVGRSSQLHARMGHSIIRVQDFSNNYDYLANWGMFDFRDPLFIPKFFRGDLLYRMAFSPFERTISYYRDVEKRAVFEDVIDLTTQQKKKLIEKILWNAKPENVYYSYQFFRNNCATKPRDYLDLAMDGGLRQQLENIQAQSTYREYVWHNMASNLIVGWGLDVIFNSDTDISLTSWQELFYPLKLKEYLRSLNHVDDSGQVISGRPLVSESRVLVDLPELKASSFNGYSLTALLTGMPLIFALAMFIRARRSLNGKSSQSIYLRMWGFVSIWWGGTSGFFGIIHSLAWLLSSHTDLYHNVNITLFWPIDGLLVVRGFQLLSSGKVPNSGKILSIGFWRIFAQIHLVLAVAYVIFAYLGLTQQRSERVMLCMVPLSLLYYGGMILLIKDPNRANG